MIRSGKPLTLALCAAIAAFALSACDRGTDAADTTADPDVSKQPVDGMAGDTTAPAAADPAASAVTVSSVQLGSAVGDDNRVTEVTAAFAPGDTIHASVATSGDGGTVSTRWTYQDGQVVNTEDKIVPAGEQVTDFMITNPAGWPTGHYTLEVSVDGKVVQTQAFEVVE